MIPGSLHQEVLGIPPPSEVELQELQFLTGPDPVSRGAASPTGILSVGVGTAPGLMAVTKAPEASDDFRMLTDDVCNLLSPTL